MHSDYQTIYHIKKRWSDSHGLRKVSISVLFRFFFQAEDGIRDLTVTGVQTCALPILAEVRWAVWRERPLDRVSGLGWLRDAVRRKSYSGSADLSLPTAAEPAVQLTSLTLPLDAAGDYVLEAELRVPGQAPIRSAFGFRVAEGLTTGRRRPLLPDYLVDRIVLRDSLRADGEGGRFNLSNPTRPAGLTADRT